MTGFKLNTRYFPPRYFPAPGEGEFGGQLPPGPPDSGKPGIFAAIQQQLGLRIEATRGPIETLAIDGLDRPSDN
jgi:uncharacterized protein (TIGR03435 family)